MAILNKGTTLCISLAGRPSNIGTRFRGCSVSMPFKEMVIPLAEELNASAEAIESVNTIVNIASIRGISTMPGRIVYSPAKAAVI